LRLRRDGRRVRIEPFWCSYLIDSSLDTAQVAFAINRAVGNAVVRNRLRRRSRVVLEQLALPAGLYLIGCRPGAHELTFEHIQLTLGKLVAKIDSTVNR
jgi:ribonuclease P protein component